MTGESKTIYISLKSVYTGKFQFQAFSESLEIHLTETTPGDNQGGINGLREFLDWLTDLKVQKLVFMETVEQLPLLHILQSIRSHCEVVFTEPTTFSLIDPSDFPNIVFKTIENEEFVFAGSVNLKISIFESVLLRERWFLQRPISLELVGHQSKLHFSTPIEELLEWIGNRNIEYLVVINWLKPKDMHDIMKAISTDDCVVIAKPAILDALYFYDYPNLDFDSEDLVTINFTLSSLTDLISWYKGLSPRKSITLVLTNKQNADVINSSTITVLTSWMKNHKIKNLVLEGPLRITAFKQILGALVVPCKVEARKSLIDLINPQEFKNAILPLYTKPIDIMVSLRNKDLKAQLESFESFDTRRKVNLTLVAFKQKYHTEFDIEQLQVWLVNLKAKSLTIVGCLFPKYTYSIVRILAYGCKVVADFVKSGLYFFSPDDFPNVTFEKPDFNKKLKISVNYKNFERELNRFGSRIRIKRKVDLVIIGAPTKEKQYYTIHEKLIKWISTLDVNNLSFFKYFGLNVITGILKVLNGKDIIVTFNGTEEVELLDQSLFPNVKLNDVEMSVQFSSNIANKTYLTELVNGRKINFVLHSVDFQQDEAYFLKFLKENRFSKVEFADRYFNIKRTNNILGSIQSDQCEVYLCKYAKISNQVLPNNFKHLRIYHGNITIDLNKLSEATRILQQFNNNLLIELHIKGVKQEATPTGLLKQSSLLDTIADKRISNLTFIDNFMDQELIAILKSLKFQCIVDYEQPYIFEVINPSEVSTVHFTYVELYEGCSPLWMKHLENHPSLINTLDIETNRFHSLRLFASDKIVNLSIESFAFLKKKEIKVLLEYCNNLKRLQVGGLPLYTMMGLIPLLGGLEQDTINFTIEPSFDFCKGKILNYAMLPKQILKQIPVLKMVVGISTKVKKEDINPILLKRIVTVLNEHHNANIHILHRMIEGLLKNT